mmetsp:Transcript_38122/g.73844  ORF Transcript_38122/g.73844 Transcript_38122/m.73844 type:complete len:260 (-) Transcript_38122:351-1130(-)
MQFKLSSRFRRDSNSSSLPVFACRSASRSSIFWSTSCTCCFRISDAFLISSSCCIAASKALCVSFALARLMAAGTPTPIAPTPPTATLMTAALATVTPLTASETPPMIAPSATSPPITSAHVFQLHLGSLKVLLFARRWPCNSATSRSVSLISFKMAWISSMRSAPFRILPSSSWSMWPTSLLSIFLRMIRAAFFNGRANALTLSTIFSGFLIASEIFFLSSSLRRPFASSSTISLCSFSIFSTTGRTAATPACATDTC